jgi:hypothetical protein
MYEINSFFDAIIPNIKFQYANFCIFVDFPRKWFIVPFLWPIWALYVLVKPKLWNQNIADKHNSDCNLIILNKIKKLGRYLFQ